MSICHLCESPHDVTYCDLTHKNWCERCHVDEYDFSCELRGEWKGRRWVATQHPELADA